MGTDECEIGIVCSAFIFFTTTMHVRAVIVQAQDAVWASSDSAIIIPIPWSFFGLQQHCLLLTRTLSTSTRFWSSSRKCEMPPKWRIPKWRKNYGNLSALALTMVHYWTTISVVLNAQERRPTKWRQLCEFGRRPVLLFGEYELTDYNVNGKVFVVKIKLSPQSNTTSNLKAMVRK